MGDWGTMDGNPCGFVQILAMGRIIYDISKGQGASFLCIFLFVLAQAGSWRACRYIRISMSFQEEEYS